MNFEIFDNFLDSVFVINGDRDIVYCNDAASVLTEFSVKRLQKKKIFDVFNFENKELFVMPNGLKGKDSKHPFEEVKFNIESKNKEGRVQLSISPIESITGNWLVVLHDVTLEEQLHVKYLIELNIKEKVIEDLKSAQKALEAYSKNLEQMVKERTKELSDANLLLNAIMDSLGQGFLVFDHQAKAGAVYTKACLDILETEPANKNVVDILRLEGDEKEQFGQWVQTAFAEVLPFESMVELGPKTFNHSENRHIVLDFYPIRDEETKIKNIVLVATDKTKEHQAEIAAQKEKAYSNMIVRLVRNKNQFANFLKTAQERLESLIYYSKNQDKFDVMDIFRILHTLEGEAGAFGATVISQKAKECQAIIEPLKNNPNEDLNKYFQGYVKEAKLLSKQFQDFLVENDELFLRLGVYGGRKVEINEHSLKGYYNYLNSQNVGSEVLKRFREEFLKEPAEKFLTHYDEIIKTIAEKQGKKVMPLKIVNGTLKISPELFKPLFSTFVHAFRNAVDHGIETPEIRKMEGKLEQGRIQIKCSQLVKEDQSFLKVEIEDDGRGIDVEKLREKLAAEDKNLSDFEVRQFIFKAGLSSREIVGEFSGRGVGMDAIKNEVERLGGTIVAESDKGKGTKIIIEVPEGMNADHLQKSA